MLSITVVGNLTNDVVLKTDEHYGNKYAILRIASDRLYRDHNGQRPTDYLSVKVKNRLAEHCAKYAKKGCLLAVYGEFETITFDDDPSRLPGFLVKGKAVQFLFPWSILQSINQDSVAEFEAAHAPASIPAPAIFFDDEPEEEPSGIDIFPDESGADALLAG